MSADLEKLTKDPGWLWQELNRRVKLCPTPDAMQRLTSHVREKTGKNTIVAFFNNGASPEEKAAILKECLTAVVKNDFSTLLGAVAAGQAQTPEKEPEPVPEPQEAPGQPKEPEAKIEPEPVKPSKRAVTPAPPSDRAAAIAQLLEQLTQPEQRPAAPVDPDEVRKIATEIVASHLKEQVTDLRGIIADHGNQLRLQVEAHLSKIPPRDVVEIRKWDGTVKELTGLRHKQLPLIIKTVSARTASGWPVPCWWYGAPGAGKTHLWSQVADALSAKYHPIALGPTTTEGRMLGYKNLATGDFVQGLLYQPYKDGGFVNLDEIDVADPSVLVGANSLVSNSHFQFPNGEVVPRHRDFYIVASANTIGTGATGGFQRNKLDAATLDRFAKFRLEYDRELESNLCGNSAWAEYVWRVREYVEKNCTSSIYITPRASINGAALLANGVPPETVADSTVFAMMSKDIRQTVINSVGAYTP